MHCILATLSSRGKDFGNIGKRAKAEVLKRPFFGLGRGYSRPFMDDLVCVFVFIYNFT